MKKSVVIMNGELGRMFGETGLAYFTMQSQLPFGGPYENKQNLSVAG
jgi:hypothetical protein